MATYNTQDEILKVTAPGRVELELAKIPALASTNHKTSQDADPYLVAFNQRYDAGKPH